MPIPRVPERFIRHIWQHQLFTTPHLCTPDGVPVTIFSPGRVNTDGGPDFRDARIRIGTVLYHGDVELHVDGSHWRAHRHADDPHYNRVVLHVVLSADGIHPPATTASQRAVPLLALEPYLDPRAYETWYECPEDRKSKNLVPCHDTNGRVPGHVIRDLIIARAGERLEQRINSLEERLHQLMDETRNPWEQLLYENIMEGMGYAKNCVPFLELAQSLRIDILKRYDMRDALTMQSILFGAAGLLPASRKLPEQESRRYVRALRGRWKQLRPAFRVPMLHEGDWLFFRLRPANFPTARLASVSFLFPSLFADESFGRIIDIFRTRGTSPPDLFSSVRSHLTFVPDDYWSRHYHFRGVAGHRGIVLGRERIVDLLVNTVIPMVLLFSRIFHDEESKQGALSLLHALPSQRGNIITRTLRRELIKGKIRAGSAFEQQGQLQLYKFSCTEGKCRACAVDQAIHGTTP